MKVTVMTSCQIKNFNRTNMATVRNSEMTVTPELLTLYRVSERTFLSNSPAFRNSTVLCSFCPFVLLVRATCNENEYGARVE
jgi:hypothetical protein